MSETGSFSGLIKNTIIQQEDCAPWRQFELESGVVIVTHAGQKLISSETNVRQLLKDLNNYRASSFGRNVSGARNTICNGGNGTVYALGHHAIAIKESNSEQSLYNSLYRMDRLTNIVDDTLPDWVSVVDHYAIVSTRKAREFMLMRKIEDGVTIQDFKSFIETGDARFPWITDIIERDFPDIDDSHLDAMEHQREQVVSTIEQYAQQTGERFSSLLPDPNPANFLVTRLKYPIENEKFKLWIIDQ